MNLEQLLSQSNGEVRFLPIRYGGGFYCIITTFDYADDFWQDWENLVGGDSCWDNATRWFKENNGDDFYWAEGRDFPHALSKALDLLEKAQNEVS